MNGQIIDLNRIYYSNEFIDIHVETIDSIMFGFSNGDKIATIQNSYMTLLKELFKNYMLSKLNICNYLKYLNKKPLKIYPMQRNI